MAAYCSKASIDVESVAFIFDGNRIQGDQTPGDLDMEDQDEIQVSTFADAHLPAYVLTCHVGMVTILQQWVPSSHKRV